MKPPAGFRGVFRTDIVARALYSEGAGIARAIPEAVAVPRDADDAAALVAWAQDAGVALIPRGSGSGMAGGAVGGGVMVDLSRLSAIGPVDTEHRRVVVGPGALRDDLERAARAHRLRFPVDPSSSAFCTMGGMVAANAGGAHSLRHGTTRQWVAGISCVFDDGRRGMVRRGMAPPDVPAVTRFRSEADEQARSTGERLRSRSVRKDASGYALSEYAASGELVDLLVGSEGTLALFVGLELELAPLPGATSSLLSLHGSLESAVAGAATCRAHGVAACELLDRTFLDVARKGDGGDNVPAAEAALLVEIEAPDAGTAAEAAGRLEQDLLSTGAGRVRVALDPPTERALWSLRHAASPTLSRLDPALKSMQFIEDAAVPPERLPDYVRGVRNALDRRGVRCVIFGHAGDAHIHVNPLVDVRRDDWRTIVLDVLEEVTDLVAQLGGTLSGEHGDGRLRTPLLSRVLPAEALESFALVKRAFDPKGILNPGVKVAAPGQQPIEHVKYDPAEPELPAVARAALDEIERERAWHRYRLSFLDQRD